VFSSEQKGYLVSLLWIAYWVGQHRLNFSRVKPELFDDEGVDSDDPELDSDEVKQMRANEGTGKRRTSTKRASGGASAVVEASASDADADFGDRSDGSESGSGSEQEEDTLMSDAEEATAAAAAAPKKKAPAKKKRKSVGACKPSGVKKEESEDDDDGPPPQVLQRFEQEASQRWCRGQKEEQQQEENHREDLQEHQGRQQEAHRLARRSTQVLHQRRARLPADTRAKLRNLQAHHGRQRGYTRTNRTNGVRQDLFFRDSDILCLSSLCTFPTFVLLLALLDFSAKCGERTTFQRRVLHPR